MTRTVRLLVAPAGAVLIASGLAARSGPATAQIAAGATTFVDRDCSDFSNQAAAHVGEARV